jgi:membrane protein DedA with SNARE-associated domain
MHTVNLLTSLVAHHHVLAYVLIFFGLIFEGEVTLISAGILIYLGALNMPLTLFLVLTGSLVKTFYCYYLGKFIHKKWNHTKCFKYIEKRVYYFLPNFEQKPFWSIFVSKFIMWLNFSVIIFAGYSKVNFKTYLKAEVLSTLIWVPAMLVLGYFFSYTALGISREIWEFSLVILVLFIIFSLFDRLVSWVYELELFEKFYDKSE